MLFGAFGTGYFIYGKKQQKPLPLVSGILLVIFPYFVSNLTIQLLIGCALLLLPYVAARFL